MWWEQLTVNGICKSSPDVVSSAPKSDVSPRFFGVERHSHLKAIPPPPHRTRSGAPAPDDNKVSNFKTIHLLENESFCKKFNIFLSKIYSNIFYKGFWFLEIYEKIFKFSSFHESSYKSRDNFDEFCYFLLENFIKNLDKIDLDP